MVSENSGQERARILVVDDESSVRDILRDFLEYEGFDVTLAETGQDGLKFVFSEPFDLILSDLEMPVVNGIDMLKELQTLKDPPPTIIMTGYGTVETAIEAMKLGAADYILKPFQIEELAHLIRRTLDHRRLADENFRLQEMLTFYQVSDRLNSSRSIDEIVEILLDSASRELAPDMFGVWLLREGNWNQATLWPPDDQMPAAGEFLNRSFDSLALLKAFHEGEPLLLEQSRIGEYFSVDGDAAPQSSLIVPMRVHGRISGMIGAFKLNEARAYTEGTRRTLQLYADRAALAVQNIHLDDNLQTTFLQTIQSLVGALEAKDEYTKGHSERVMQWAMIIGELVGLSELALSDLQRAALLHDIGKIGINLDALNRPGKLSDTEVEEFKLHTVIGKRILEPVDFLRGSIPAVTHHHERWDGSGYPLGLESEDIPLGARILGIADSFEVMITDRVYRKALTLDEARSELQSSAGSHFDPRIVERFLEWLSTFDTLDDLPVKGGRRDYLDEQTGDEPEENVA